MRTAGRRLLRAMALVSRAHTRFRNSRSKCWKALVCWAVQHGQRREGVVLRKLFLVGHAQSVAVDAIIVKNGPGEASSHESDDGQPDLRAPVRGCKPERNGRRRCQEEAFVRPGEQ